MSWPRAGLQRPQSQEALGGGFRGLSFPEGRRRLCFGPGQLGAFSGHPEGGTKAQRLRTGAGRWGCERLQAAWELVCGSARSSAAPCWFCIDMGPACKPGFRTDPINSHPNR